jgi:hypothetical protein
MPRPPSYESRNYARVFETFGVQVSVNGSVEALADACPWCGKDRFHINIKTGLFHCKHCEEGQGNIYYYLTWLHGHYLAQTTTDDYRALKAKRSIACQTLKRHQLAYAKELGCWLVPFKTTTGSVANLMRYYPDRPKPNKYMLPELPTAIYGFDQLAAADRGKPVLLCEGPFDAIAADYSIGAENRAKYVIVATPGAFKEEWAEHFRGRKVRALYDNDEGGRQQAKRVQRLLGESRVADELLVLRWPPEFPDGYDINDLVRDHPDLGVVGFVRANSFKVVPEPKLAWEHGWERAPTGAEAIDWVWPDRLRCGSYASFSGKRGTLKSTVMREIVALYTQGKPLPGCKEVGLPAGHVLYITAEDGKETAWAGLELAKANRKLISILPATLKDGDPLNILEHLDELRQAVRQYAARLVVIDGQNSVVGAPNISTDMLARHNITNMLHQFAQKEYICLVGIRNEDTEGRALGPQSMSDLGRCILRTTEEKRYRGQRYFVLKFERISDAAPHTHPDLPYSVQDLGGSSRRILWGERRPAETKGKSASEETDEDGDREVDSPGAGEEAQVEEETPSPTEELPSAPGPSEPCNEPGPRKSQLQRLQESLDQAKQNRLRQPRAGPAASSGQDQGT